jgi:KaiC/GvpD/RAD55 family RecA-like ATPase
MVTRDLEGEIARKLKDNKGIYVLASSAEEYEGVKMSALRVLVNIRKQAGIYVTLTKPYMNLRENFENNGVNISRLYFIDCISLKEGKRQETDNCTYISGPTSLTELSLAITAAANTGKLDFLFLDSVSSLLMYNDRASSAKFFHYLISKMLSYEIGGVILAFRQDKETIKLLPVLMQFCDECIEIG